MAIVAIIIKNIETNLEQVEQRFKNESSFRDKLLFDAGCMALFQVLNRSIDLSEEVILQKHLPFPASYGDSFTVLKDNKIIDQNTCDKMKKLVTYRNLISHEYYNITPKDVKKILAQITIIEIFLDRVRKLF